MTSTDESLRIWNFWPNIAFPGKSGNPRSIHSSSISTKSVQPKDGYDGRNEKHGRQSSCYWSNQLMMSQLSFDASRVIK